MKARKEILNDIKENDPPLFSVLESMKNIDVKEPHKTMFRIGREIILLSKELD